MHKRFKEGVFIIFMAFAAFLFLALFTYDSNDPGWAYLGARTDAANAGGVAGAWFASVFLSIFGWLAWLIPCMVAWSGWMFYRERDPNNQINFSLIGMRWLGFILTLVSGVVLASMHVKTFGFPFPDGAGGILGKIISSKLLPILNTIGTTLLTIALLLGGINLFTSTSWLEVMEWIGDKVSRFFAPLGVLLAGLGLFKKSSKKEAVLDKIQNNHLSEEYEDDLISAVDMKESLQKSIQHDSDLAAQDEPFISDMKAVITSEKNNEIDADIEDINDVEFFDVGETKEVLDIKETLFEDDNELLMRSINVPITDDEAEIKSDSDVKIKIETADEITVEAKSSIDEIETKIETETNIEIEATSQIDIETVPEIKIESKPQDLEATTEIEAAAEDKITAESIIDWTDDIDIEKDAALKQPVVEDNIQITETAIIEEIEQPDIEQNINQMMTDDIEIKADSNPIKETIDNDSTANLENTLDQDKNEDEIWQISEQIKPVAHFSFENENENNNIENKANLIDSIDDDSNHKKTKIINHLSLLEKEDPVEYVNTGEPQLPHIDFLDPAKPSVGGYSEEELAHLSSQVEHILNDFKVQVKVVSIQPGPVVTMFELDIAPGIKASKITGLSTDLARALSKSSVRVVEVIPGKSVIGLEIPNEKRDIVYLREIIESPLFQDTESVLTVALGKDIVGDPVVTDLGKMPHALIAGTTGSGKSVAINTFILSLLYKATPKEVRLIMIDPKMLELSVYDGIPHLLCPVVTDMEEAANSLRWAVVEMERRYKLMSALGVRNLAGFNKIIEDSEKLGQKIADPTWQPPANATLTELHEQPTLETMPYVVIIIDELADMMMVVGKKVEELIARLAQKARAAGIHLLLATQRPSVDVITGLIKANVPSRLAFKVSSKIDSRTILDQMGAEALLGYGDSLFISPSNNIPMRTHGAFVDDHEVHKVANFLRATGETDYIQAIVKEPTEPIAGLSAEASGVASESTDVLFDEAVQIVTETGRGSISGIQRRLKIGYNRAARMIEEMENMGIVSPPENNGNRRVLVSAPPSIEEP